MIEVNGRAKEAWRTGECGESLDRPAGGECRERAHELRERLFDERHPQLLPLRLRVEQHAGERARRQKRVDRHRRPPAVDAEPQLLDALRPQTAVRRVAENAPDQRWSLGHHRQRTQEPAVACASSRFEYNKQGNMSQKIPRFEGTSKRLKCNRMRLRLQNRFIIIKTNLEHVYIFRLLQNIQML